MKSLINKITTAITGVVLFAAAGAMAGLGFMVLATLAVFTFFAIGIALLAAPFVGLAETKAKSQDEAEVAA